VSVIAYRATVAAGLLVAAAWIGHIVLPGSALFANVLTAALLLRLAAVMKLAFLLIATVAALRVARRLDADNPARRPWLAFGIGLAGFSAGQAVLSGWQIATGVTPFPSVADLFFGVAYLFLIGGLFGFVSAYREAGYPVGTAAQNARFSLVVAAVLALLGYPVVAPILAAPGPLLHRAITALYPVLDLVLLVPALALLRITAGFGGRVSEIWTRLLAGLLCVAAADAAFAYVSVLGITGLDPLLHALFILSYLLLAEGTRRQHTLLS
jgi:hypothetical protein